MRPLARLATCALLTVALLVPLALGAAAAPGVAVGSAAPQFSLPDARSDRAISLADYKGKIVVIEFRSTQCPICHAYDARVNAFVARYAAGTDARVVFLGIDSNRGESVRDIRAQAREVDAKYPILKDAGSKVADRFGASCTPHIFVIDGAGVVRYIGAIDDNMDAARVQHHYLADAVDDLLAGRAVAVAQTKAFGCAIQRSR